MINCEDISEGNALFDMIVIHSFDSCPLWYHVIVVVPVTLMQSPKSSCMQTIAILEIVLTVQVEW